MDPTPATAPEEILPDLFHFTQVHPSIGIEVSSYYLYGERVLIDPMIPAGGIEWFEEQDTAYREAVLPASVTARVSVEAGLALSWHRYLGTRGRAVSIEHFGASADYKTLFREFGITAEAVVAAAKESLASA